MAGTSRLAFSMHLILSRQSSGQHGGKVMNPIFFYPAQTDFTGNDLC